MLLNRPDVTLSLWREHPEESKVQSAAEVTTPKVRHSWQVIYSGLRKRWGVYQGYELVTDGFETKQAALREAHKQARALVRLALEGGQDAG